MALVTIKEEKGESLRTFMKIFGKKTLSICNMNLEVALHRIGIVLRSRPFADSLWNKLTIDLDELRYRATKFMQLEELKDFKNKVSVESNLAKKKLPNKDIAQKVGP